MMNSYSRKLDQAIFQFRKSTCVDKAHKFQVEVLSLKLGLSKADIKSLIEALGYNFDKPLEPRSEEWVESFAKWQ